MSGSSTSTLSTSTSNGITLASSISSFIVTSTGTINTPGWRGIEAQYNATILNAGSINAYLYGVQLEGGGGVTNAAGGIIQGRLFNGVNTFNDPITVNNAGTISGGGVGLELRGSGNTVIDSGVISGGAEAIYFGGNNASDTLTIEPGAQLNGGVYIQSTTETLNIVGEGFAAGDTIALNVQSVPSSQYIPGMFYGPGMSMPGFTQYNPGYAVASITNSAGQIVESIDIKYNDPNSGALTAALADPACFLGGTRLRGVATEIAVEDIIPGTLLQTTSGQALPVRWLGRSVVSTRFADKLRVLPIRIRAGALGENLPVRDLLVSPDHAIFIGGMLIQAGALVNGVSILRETNVPEVFTYYHVELASHELLLAEGAAAESFVDNVDRMNFANWAEHEALGEVAPIEEMPYPRAKAHRQVPRAVRQILETRAKLYTSSSQMPSRRAANHAVAEARFFADGPLHEAQADIGVPEAVGRPAVAFTVES